MIRLEGVSLHRALPSAVVVSRIDAPTSIAFDGEIAPLSRISPRGGDRASIAVLPSGRTLRGLEHLLAAVTGLGAFDGVSLALEAEEPPLLDGGARAFADAIAALDPPRCGRVARIVRDDAFTLDDACFTFRRGGALDLAVEVDFPAERFGRRLAGAAAWRGDRTEFLASIATARTFGAARELEALRARGLAAHVPEGAVVALDLDDPRRAPADRDEPIRHKLLDLLGDLAPLGAPLRGSLRVERPSHRATAAGLERALEEKIVVVD